MHTARGGKESQLYPAASALRFINDSPTDDMPTDAIVSREQPVTSSKDLRLSPQFETHTWDCYQY